MNDVNEAIPFLDLVTPHVELKEELTMGFQAALATAGFIGGPVVAGFEQDFAAFCETKHCVGVGSGTDALRFALTAAGIGAGDVVVTVPNTFIATTEAISQAGALPEFVDIDERTYNMDPEKLREYLEGQCRMDVATGRLISNRSGRRVAGVVPVHLYGQMADMDPILDLAERYHLVVVEDACQAHGAEYYSRRQQHWCKAGSMGKAAAFSFYPGKNLGACGEAGAATTNDDEVAGMIRMLRDHGQVQKYYHDVEGYNGRLDAIQAAILQVKLRHLPGWNAGRQAAAQRYFQLFDQASLAENPELIAIPYIPDWSRPVHHLFVIRTSDRAGLMKRLAEENIGSGIHYPIPLHLQKAYAGMQYAQGDFPVSEAVAPQIVSLPMFPTLTETAQKRVAEAIAQHHHDVAMARTV